jgi:tetratricopeptide (TPR) repeat protein
MTAGPEAAAGDPASGSAIVMHGQSHDASTFRQTGIEVNINLPPLPAAPEVRYSLPADAAAFTGRGQELSQVTAALKAAAGAGGVVAVRAIDGMPGAGKTALAVHAAHLLRDRFPDRQLFVDLHAHTPGREPVRPEDALAGLLAAAGVEPRFLPADLDGRAAMWRDKMARQRALLVLDNAASTGQVAPLLPGGEGCLVLVTSRRYLGDLPGAVVPVLLDVLPPPQAQEMFTQLAPRAAGSPSEVAEVVQLAGFLPLAISLLARVFARHRSWTLADLAAETRESLLTLTAEHDSIAAAFEVSYRHLEPARRRFFCLLGLHPGATTDCYAAAALAGTSLDEAAGLLNGLHGEGLLAETGHRRYGMHDLLRRYARDHATVTTDDSQQALDRLLDYYQHTAARADDRLARQTRPGPPPTRSEAAPDLNDDSQALAWARADRASLLACLDYATRTRQYARVIAFTTALAGLLRRDGPWADAIARHTVAAQAARHLGDRLGQANALSDLGDVRRLTDDYPAAAQALEQALDIYRDLGNRLGQANALSSLGIVQWLTGDFPGAAQMLEQALGIYHDLGDQLGQANALKELGNVRYLTDDYRGAAQMLEQALGIYHDLGDQLGQVNALLGLGAVRRPTGDFPGAAQALEQALNIYHDLGDQLGQANALKELGNVRSLTGDFPGAAQMLEQALNIYRDLGNRGGEANALFELGNVWSLTGDFPGAAQMLEQALDIHRDLGNRLGQANALNCLGVARRLAGDYPGAAQALEQALDIYRDLGDRGGEVTALNERGALHRVSGELVLAEGCHQQALELARAIASSWDEAHALAGLGRCAMAFGHATPAEVLLRRALEIFQRIGAAEAPALLAELDAITGPRPPP